MTIRVHAKLSAALAALLFFVGASGALQADDAKESMDAWLRVGRRAASSVVRIQWRSRGGLAPPVERSAVVLDSAGWLLMAGPPPGRDGTLAASLADGRTMRAEVWARDARSALTLLRIPVTDLPALALRKPPARGANALVPPRISPGTELLMVTPEGAIAKGNLRANHRMRALPARAGRPGTTVTCLDEAALTVVPTDLGSPWIDADGHLIGLLVGAEVAVLDPQEAPDEVSTLRPQVVAAYAVPCDVVRIVWPLLRDRRTVERAAIGIRSRRLDPAVTHHLCPDCGGWVVTAVQPEGPAAEAGVKAHDIVRRIGGAALAPGAYIADALLPYRPGETTAIQVLREGKAIDLEVTLGVAQPPRTR